MQQNKLSTSAWSHPPQQQRSKTFCHKDEVDSPKQRMLPPEPPTAPRVPSKSPAEPERLFTLSRSSRGTFTSTRNTKETHSLSLTFPRCIKGPLPQTRRTTVTSSPHSSTSEIFPNSTRDISSRSGSIPTISSNTRSNSSSNITTFNSYTRPSSSSLDHSCIHPHRQTPTLLLLPEQSFL